MLTVKRQTQDFWGQQKQAYIDSQAHLGSWLSVLFDSKTGLGVSLPIMSVEKLKAESHS